MRKLIHIFVYHGLLTRRLIPRSDVFENFEYYSKHIFKKVLTPAAQSKTFTSLCIVGHNSVKKRLKTVEK